MMQDDDNLPDRDAWRRVLQRGAGEPPRTTDERIRAEARRALAPHTGRWWLPASLAASLLLAVLVVQWQYEDIRSPALVTESDIAPAADRASAAGPATEQATAPAAAEEAYVPAPAMELPALPAAPPAAGEAAVAAAPQHEAGERAEPGKLAVPALKAEATQVTGMRQSTEARAPATISADQSLTPEQWYAQIEELRAAGREAEAEAELRRLEQAFPGWLEQRLRETKVKE
jgi:hypothetical protein